MKLSYITASMRFFFTSVLWRSEAILLFSTPLPLLLTPCHY